MKYVFPFVNVSLSIPLVFSISVRILSHYLFILVGSLLLKVHPSAFISHNFLPNRSCFLGRNVYLGTMALWPSLVITCIYKHSSKDTQDWRAKNDTLRIVHGQPLKKSAFLFGSASPSYKTFTIPPAFSIFLSFFKINP